jgi:ribA/ribD-fused uncharacterized protein
MKKFSTIDWKTIATHDESNVKGFFGPCRFLSNFHLCKIEFEGRFYPSTENAYQAAKIVHDERGFFTTCSPNESKTLWKKLTKIDSSSIEWDARRLYVMNPLVIQKFTEHDDLKQLLLDTGDRYLEETNWWEDSFWGVDTKLGGKNHLGKLLMEVRTSLRQK